MNNQPKKVTVVSAGKCAAVLSQRTGGRCACYYLSDNYGNFVDLRNRFSGALDIKNLSGVFDKTFQEIKATVLTSLSCLNKKYDSYAWWGGMLASKSTSSTPLVLNITYLFCAKKILSEEHGEIIFIIDSHALSSCLAKTAQAQGHHVTFHGNGYAQYGEYVRRFLRYFMQVGSFFLKTVQNHMIASKLSKPTLQKKSQAKKRIVIRSWVTKNSFNNPKEFQDRNFGQLPQWLSSKGYEVWLLPMFFNISREATQEVYAALRDHGPAFLVPEHYLAFTDYIRTLYNGYRVFARNIKELKIDGTDVSGLFNEALKRRGFDVGMCLLNLSCPMMRRLKKFGFEVDGIYYAFENSASEKQFILTCRECFPDADITGYQHTTFFPNQLAHHLAPGESDFHPLPDRIICSGPGYVNLHKKARFSPDILEDGPNLRFKDVYLTGDRQKAFQGLSGGDEKILLLPLTFSHDLAFELFTKVRDALKGEDRGFRVYIRTHPLLSKKVLEDFLRRIDMSNYVFADEGIIQDWLPKTYAVVSTGGTVVILEAAAFGTPVIRVIPDNTFYYDPFAHPNYPLEPVSTSLEIRRQLQMIDGIRNNGNGVFEQIAREALSDYFRQPNEENLKVFL